MIITPRLIKVNNFTEGRLGQKIEAIVMHIMEGTMEGTDSWFRKDESNVSSHFGVAKDGRIFQWVAEEDSAWHAGTVKKPSHPLVRQKGAINPNHYTIGIEHEGFANEQGHDKQIEASAELVAYLCKKYKIECNITRIILHREIRSDKTCPGNLPVNEIIERAQDILTGSFCSLEHRVDRIERFLRDIKIKLNGIYFEEYE